MVSNVLTNFPVAGVAPNKADFVTNWTTIRNEISALQATLAAEIYVEDYAGANPNGVATTNATAINAAILDASNYTVAGQRRGGTVKLGKGTWVGF